jgi:hypothetical protein
VTGLVAMLAAVLGFGSCALTGVREEPRPAECGATAVEVDFRVDVDGDGRTDTVAHDATEPFHLLVCFATGKVVVANDKHRPTQPLYAVDVDHDGAFELFPGYVSSYATYYMVLRWDGRVFRDIVHLQDNAPGVEPNVTFGCEPPNRVVQVGVNWPALEATVTTHSFAGGHDTKTERTVNVPRDADHATYAQSLVTPCDRLPKT